MYKSFQLNGVSFETTKELISYSKQISNSLFQFLSYWFDERDFLEVQTSGSTGKPKIIQLQKEHMKNSARATGEFFKLNEKTTALVCLSADYIAGKMMVVRALTLGWHIDVIESVANPLSKTTKVYDFSAMVPMQLQHSLSEIHRVKKLIVGGGVVSSELQDKIQEIPTEIFATYGMTETITHIAVKKLNHIQQKAFYETLPEVTIYRDQRNCLVIQAPRVAQELVITNDVVQLVAENKFEWLGRYDNVINSGGVKLQPEAIEEKLSKIITDRFFVAGMKDPLLGEKLILLVESNSEGMFKKEELLKKELSKLTTLHKYEIPKAIYFLPTFVETETKKIMRKKTLELVLS